MFALFLSWYFVWTFGLLFQVDYLVWVVCIRVFLFYCGSLVVCLVDIGFLDLDGLRLFVLVFDIDCCGFGFWLYLVFICAALVWFCVWWWFVFVFVRLFDLLSWIAWVCWFVWVCFILLLNLCISRVLMCCFAVWFLLLSCDLVFVSAFVWLVLFVLVCLFFWVGVWVWLLLCWPLVLICFGLFWVVFDFVFVCWPVCFVALYNFEFCLVGINELWSVTTVRGWYNTVNCEFCG